MDLVLKILFHLCLCAGVQCVHQVSWLPCKFIDEKVSLNPEGHIETQHIPRDALLQFGQKGDAPVYPHALTFLVTGSKLDMRRYLEDAEAEQMECELRRYSTQGIHVRWPVKADQEYNRWFTCTLTHTKGLFTVTSFLRQPSDEPPSGTDDFRNWTPIEDSDILTTTVAMVTKTGSASLKATLLSKQKLHCEFAVDHKGADFTLEWHRQHRGEKVKLFSHNSRTGQTEGSGVVVRSLAGGDASLSIPLTQMSSEGAYACSVAVNPLFLKMDTNLYIEEAPSVFLNVGQALTLQEGETHKVSCDAENYYPLDVEIQWYHQDPSALGQRVGAPLPKVLQNVLHSSHRRNTDKTFSLSAFFYLEGTLKDSGRQFTCSVSHQSLRVPIKKSFILTVEEQSNWMFYLIVGLTLFILLFILKKTLPPLIRAKRRSVQQKPY